MLNRPRVAIPRGCGFSASLVLWVFLVGQSGDCERPTGNTQLTLLELEDDGQNVVMGFMSSQRIYDVTVSKNPVTVRAQSVEAGAIVSVSYLGASHPMGVGGGEVDVSVALGESTLFVIVEATGGLTQSYALNVTHDVPPQTKAITVACANNVVLEPNVLDFDLTVAAPSVAGGPTPSDFTASFSGAVRFPRFYLNAASNLVPGGLQQAIVDEVTATVQSRSGATGSDVELHEDLDAIVPGPTHLCVLPEGQVCDPANDVDPNDPSQGNTDCLGGALPCQPEVTLIDFPISTDCGAGGVCDSIGEGFPNLYSSCSYNGFCITDDLLIPLAPATGVFTPDASGDILFGWADQNVPDLVLCPAAAPDCAEAFHPDGSYDLPSAVYANPSAPMGLRMDLASLFIPLQCAMAEPGGVCTGQTNVGCLTDSDCGGSGPCDFTVEGVSMPTPDASLIAVPIEDPNP
jgi:hypothetical protein